MQIPTSNPTQYQYFILTRLTNIITPHFFIGTNFISMAINHPSLGPQFYLGIDVY